MDACDWNAPGADRYTGGLHAALVSYGFPTSAMAEIIEKRRRTAMDGILVVTRDEIRSLSERYVASDFRDMHFNRASRCSGYVNRAGWASDKYELAPVYCSGAYCVAIPLVCQNVSLVTWTPNLQYGQPVPRAVPTPVPENEPTPDTEVPVHTVPEPGSMALVAAALLGLVVTRGMRRMPNARLTGPATATQEQR